MEQSFPRERFSIPNQYPRECEAELRAKDSSHVWVPILDLELIRFPKPQLTLSTSSFQSCGDHNSMGSREGKVGTGQWRSRDSQTPEPVPAPAPRDPTSAHPPVQPSPADQELRLEQGLV